ncbi:MAG: hypothetical protein IJF40_05810 [Clostridia bacterium]|nr:hypothetical protein [Clostridia bacterium]
MKKEDKLIKDMLSAVQVEKQKAITKIPLDAEIDSETLANQQNLLYKRILEQTLKIEEN